MPEGYNYNYSQAISFFIQIILSRLLLHIFLFGFYPLLYTINVDACSITDLNIFSMDVHILRNLF